MVISSLTSQWPMLVGLGLLGLFVYWFVDELDFDERDPVAAAEGVGDRANRATGQTLGTFGAIVAGLAMIAMTVGQQLMSAASGIEPLVGSVPVVIGHVIVGALGYLSLSGAIGLSPKDYGYIFVLVTVVALIIRYGRD